MRKLYISQHGEKFFAETLKELKEQLSGRVSIMYRDKKDGSTVRCGYVIGHNWLTCYSPVETIVKEATKEEAA